jgi:membrane fusion protein
MSSLYRKAALDAQATTPLGRIILVQPPSYRLLTAMCAAFAGIVLAFFFLGSYTRHSTAAGQLLPDAGLIKLYSPRPGVVLERQVREDQPVKAGDVLFVISGERPGGMGGEDWRARPSPDGVVAAGERRLLVSKAEELRRQLDILGEQIDNQQSRVELSRKTVRSYQDLLARRYISAEQLQQKQEDLLDQQARLQALERERLALTHELGAQYLVITATQDGTATALNAEVGQSIDGQRPLLSIVPARSALNANLFAPSRAVGFVRAGDRVMLRYQAYPYQKFGHYGGVVSWVSRTAVSPAEIAALNPPPQGHEPLYEIRVKLDRQTVTAYGREQALQSGMAVEADILQDRRRLYEWVLEPLFTLSGKV